MRVLDQWENDDGERFRLRVRELHGGRPFYDVQRYSKVADGWRGGSPDDALERLALRIYLNNVEARRISFLAAALMRCLQLAEKLVDDAPGGMARLTRGHLAAVKGVLLACKMPLERWKVELDGVEEDPETAEARRRLGLDPPQAASS